MLTIFPTVSVGVDVVGALVGVKDGKDIKIIVRSEDGKDVGAIVGADVIVKSVVGLCVGLIVFVLPSYTRNVPFLESEVESNQREEWQHSILHRN